MKRWLRYHHYAFQVALRRLSVQPFSSVANLLVIALTLAIPILGGALLQSAQPVVREIPISPELTVFMQQNAELSAAQNTASQVQERFGELLAGVRTIERDQALAGLKNNPAWSEALAVLPDNPLPHAVVITLLDAPDLSARATTLATELQTWPQVDTVQLDSEWVQRLESILHFIEIGFWIVVAGVSIVVIATVFNTVRLQALSQREEIAVARLVGADEGFVRRPFLYLGALTGLAASALACTIAWLALIPLNQALDQLAASYGTQIVLHMPSSSMLLTGAIAVAILAATAARWSVTRHTQF
ncbi:cell division protein FtsX [Alcaligenes endophyticus]|uniref:Cell division protein FtsX n=1 Tax=Alcaligenes endophyticus TaxID=1929088 RepID=A0ABT8ELV6_9BURK|nr:ABC transporter permease [Alcaligenes endophyticus]MCX5591161.1 ABC transporter permease [Alcaligenes endophyticus]MDN4122261.1 ABC transporter permease [Alcaligenes endophyticus]